MNRLALLRDCLLFFAIGMAFGCCGCLVQPTPETVKLDDVSTLMSSHDGNHAAEPASQNGNSVELVEAVPAVTKDPEPSDRQELLKPIAAPEPIYTPQTFETRKPEQPEQPQAKATTKGYTGALVYVAEDCPPCHYLETDLRYLEAKYHWTLSQETDERPTDWVITQRPSPSGQNPLIEFYKNGELIATAQGYDSRPSFTDRKESLRKLIKAHPASGKEIK